MEAQHKNQFSTSNYQQLNDPTFMKLKLDTSDLLIRVENFLSARKVEIVRGENGELFQREKIGVPFANEQGVEAIMGMLDIRANNHSVQGNLKKDELQDYLYYARLELTEAIVLNCYLWGIDDAKLNVIIDTLMSFLWAFFTRTIDNKERESLIPSFTSSEFIRGGEEKQGLLKNFTGGFK